MKENNIAAPANRPPTKEQLKSFLAWVTSNHVKPFGKYWRKDYSILLYTQDQIVEQFFLSQQILQ